MKKYWVIFILTITVSLAGFATVIYKCFIQPKVVCLDIDKMKEENLNVLDTNKKFEVVAIFPANKINLKNDTIPWADVYVCNSFSKQDSLSGDTKFIILDIHTKADLENIKDIYDYTVFVKEEKVFKKCKVIIPYDQESSINQYKYKLGDVKLEFTGEYD
jgi:hypothetical protein